MEEKNKLMQELDELLARMGVGYGKHTPQNGAVDEDEEEEDEECKTALSNMLNSIIDMAVHQQKHHKVDGTVLEICMGLMLTEVDDRAHVRFLADTFRRALNMRGYNPFTDTLSSDI